MGGQRKQQIKGKNPARPTVLRKGKKGDLIPDLGQKPGKKRPRGRPWPKGVSGNPKGRPKGARNKFTEAVLEGIRRAEAKLAQPRKLNRDKPYECWDGYLIQEGLRYDWNTEELLPGQEPAPQPPKRFNPGERRTEMTWKGRTIYVQNGWPFNPRTWRRLKM